MTIGDAVAGHAVVDPVGLLSCCESFILAAERDKQTMCECGFCCGSMHRSSSGVWASWNETAAEIVAMQQGAQVGRLASGMGALNIGQGVGGAAPRSIPCQSVRSRSVRDHTQATEDEISGSAHMLGLVMLFALEGGVAFAAGVLFARWMWLP